MNKYVWLSQHDLKELNLPVVATWNQMHVWSSESSQVAVVVGHPALCHPLLTLSLTLCLSFLQLLLEVSFNKFFRSVHDHHWWSAISLE